VRTPLEGATSFLQYDACEPGDSPLLLLLLRHGPGYLSQMRDLGSVRTSQAPHARAQPGGWRGEAAAVNQAHSST
jgi:hypothetical protein